MKSSIGQYLAILIPLYFAALWLTITTVLGVASGWYRLVARFPDQIEEPLLQIRGQSGTMGLRVRMRGVLTLSVCSSGLRVGIMRLLGPFCRDFFVPWEAISIARKNDWLGSVARLQFGNPGVGSLTIRADVADKLAHAAMGAWPENRAVP